MSGARGRFDVRERVFAPSGGERRAKQAPRDECDLNKVVERYTRTGLLPAGSGVGRYLDVSNVGSYLDAMLTVKSAEEAFASLPSRVRDRFRNSPEAMVRFVLDKANEVEARELGLLKPKAVPAQPDAGALQPDKPAK